MAALNNDSTTDSGHLVVDVPALASTEEEVQEQDTGAGVVSAVTTASAGAVTTSCRDGVAVNTSGAGAAVITGAGAGFVITTSGAGAVTVTNAGGTGGGAINTSGAGAVNTSASGALRKRGCDLEAEEQEEEDEGDGEQMNGENLPWMVGVLGGLANGTATVAALYRSPRPRGGEVVYCLGIASVFAAGVGEMLAALWVSGDTRKRGRAGKKILCVSLVTVLLGLALNGFAYLLRKSSP